MFIILQAGIVGKRGFASTKSDRPVPNDLGDVGGPNKDLVR